MHKSANVLSSSVLQYFKHLFYISKLLPKDSMVLLAEEKSPQRF